MFGRAAEGKYFFAFFIAIAFLVLFSLIVQNPLPAADQMERARVAREVVATGSLPVLNQAYGPAVPNTYAPAFDLLVASLSIFSGVEFTLIWNVLSFILLFLLFTYSFKLSRLFLPHTHSLYAACLVAVLPWIFRRVISPLPESFGLVLFLLLLYYAFRRNFTALAIIFPLLAILHYRSFLTFAAVYIAFSAWFLMRRKASAAELLKPAPLAATVLLVWFAPRLSSFAFSPISNPWLIPYSLFDMFSYALFFAALFLAVEFFALRRLSAVSLIFIAGAALAFMPVLGDTAFRMAAYIFFPAAFMSAAFIRFVESKTKPAAGLALFVLLFAALALTSRPIVFENDFFSADYVASMRVLGEFPANGNEIVLTDFVSGYAVPYYSGKAVVAGAFLEALPDADERANETFVAFKNCSFPRALVEKYNAALVLITKKARELGCSNPVFEQSVSKVYDSGQQQAYLLN